MDLFENANYDAAIGDLVIVWSHAMQMDQRTLDATARDFSKGVATLVGSAVEKLLPLASPNVRQIWEEKKTRFWNSPPN